MIMIHWKCMQCGHEGEISFDPHETILSAREKVKLEHKEALKKYSIPCVEYRLGARMMFTKGQFKGV